MEEELSRDSEVEDLHICGTCREKFCNINLFVEHKKICKSKKTSSSAKTIEHESVHKNKNEKQMQNKAKAQQSKQKVSPKSKTLVEISVTNENVVNKSIDEFHTECNESEQNVESEDSHSRDVEKSSLSNSKDATDTSAGVQTVVSSTGTTMRYSHVVRGNGKKFKCEFESTCVFSTNYLKDLERHYRIHTGEKPYTCSHCHRSFNRSDKLTLHERSHTGEKPYKCEECSYASSDRSSLVKHQRIHTDERPYKCQLCRYASRNSSQLVVHLRTHTGDAPFRCVSCPASFKINSDLKRHLRLHTGEKPFACDQCDYRCAIKGNLRMHIKLNHSNESQTSCSQCDFVASSKRLLKEHLREHNTKSLRCDHCNYTTSSRSALNNHVRIHTNEKPYECEVCGYACRQACNLRTHMKKKHPDFGVGFIRKKRKIKSKSQVIRKDGHRGKARAYCQTVHSCHLCDCSFVREDSLRSHIRHHQDVLPQTGAALAILQLQQDNVVHEEMVNVSIAEEKHMESVDDETEPQGIEFEVETSEKSAHESSSKKNENTIPVNSHLYQRLMHNNPESNSDQSSGVEPKTIYTKRGRPLKKPKHLQVTHQTPSNTASQPLRLVASQTASGQVLYQLPSGMRVVPYLSVSGQSNSIDTVLVINGETITASSDSILTTSQDSND